MQQAQQFFPDCKGECYHDTGINCEHFYECPVSQRKEGLATAVAAFIILSTLIWGIILILLIIGGVLFD